MDTLTKNREYCVICNNSILIPINTFKLAYYVIKNKDEYDVTHGYCEKCYSIQIMTLLNPDILYDGNYYMLPYSKNYNWIQHNISFVQFVVSSINTNEPLLEIGSSSFLLGKHLIEYYEDYTVFDISIKACEKRNNVKYIEGNCENYRFEEGTNILMSHVFEHLYEPKKFIKNCSINNVKNIIITIPNMNNDNELSITEQHSFVYNDTDINYIFELYNYKCIKQLFFNTNDKSFPCLFFHFSLNNKILTFTTPPERYIDETRHLYTKQLLSNTFNVPNNTFISSASMFSSKIFSLVNNKENIIGIIDINSKLHGEIFANTNLKIYPYDYLQNYDDANIIVYQRKNDITDCIRKFNKIINIIYL